MKMSAEEIARLPKGVLATERCDNPRCSKPLIGLLIYRSQDRSQAYCTNACYEAVEPARSSGGDPTGKGDKDMISKSKKKTNKKAAAAPEVDEEVDMVEGDEDEEEEEVVVAPAPKKKGKKPKPAPAEDDDDEDEDEAEEDAETEDAEEDAETEEEEEDAEEEEEEEIEPVKSKPPKKAKKAAPAKRAKKVAEPPPKVSAKDRKANLKAMKGKTNPYRDGTRCAKLFKKLATGKRFKSLESLCRNIEPPPGDPQRMVGNIRTKGLETGLYIIVHENGAWQMTENHLSG